MCFGLFDVFVQENTNKAAIADFWIDNPDECTAAFAAATFFNGYASAFGYFTFPHLQRITMASIIVATSCLGIFSYLVAFSLYESNRIPTTAAAAGAASGEVGGDSGASRGGKSKKRREEYEYVPQTPQSGIAVSHSVRVVRRHDGSSSMQSVRRYGTDSAVDNVTTQSDPDV